VFHETGETPGTVGTLLTPVFGLKSIKKGIITSVFCQKKA